MHMIILIAGASHTGKTVLAQNLLETYHYPYLSIDHLKMGLIRSGQTALTPEDDAQLTAYLWPIVAEIVKTAVENRQNLIVEGCYIPFDWKDSFDAAYLKEIRYCCLIMTRNYLQTHFTDVQRYASIIEHRQEDFDCTLTALIAENEENLRQCRQYGHPYLLIDRSYQVGFSL